MALSVDRKGFQCSSTMPPCWSWWAIRAASAWLQASGESLPGKGLDEIKVYIDTVVDVFASMCIYIHIFIHLFISCIQHSCSCYHHYDQNQMCISYIHKRERERDSGSVDRRPSLLIVGSTLKEKLEKRDCGR